MCITARNNSTPRHTVIEIFVPKVNCVEFTLLYDVFSIIEIKTYAIERPIAELVYAIKIVKAPEKDWCAISSNVAAITKGSKSQRQSDPTFENTLR